MCVEVYPRIVKVGTTAKLEISLPKEFSTTEIELTLIPAEGGSLQKEVCNVSNQKFAVSFYFEQEME